MQLVRVGVISCAAALGLAALIRGALIVVTVDGYSMAPTLSHGDRILVLRRRFGGRARRGSIVVMLSPAMAEAGVEIAADRPERSLVKRVTALGGDPDPRGGGIVPAGSLFIVGDSAYSVDSREFGPIPAELLLGVVIRRMSAERPGSDRGR
ncbi:S26 family signal peptidase [Nonomuraea deserti]|uniref:S26 family signal peptidase n=1 Tax=Nonomuraea deserti TaxID=1848322 RepID=UPI001C706934|nr:S26 family signal peptidase [Nonomuraea deserti]